MPRLLLVLTAILFTPACMVGEADTGVDEFVVEGTREPFAGPHRVNEQEWPHAVVTDPCQCNSQACVDSWVDDNLGCNVCISLYCDGEPGGHVCAQCSIVND
jgi:hypothetical protein